MEKQHLVARLDETEKYLSGREFEIHQQMNAMLDHLKVWSDTANGLVFPASNRFPALGCGNFGSPADRCLCLLQVPKSHGQSGRNTLLPTYVLFIMCDRNETRSQRRLPHMSSAIQRF